MYAAKDVASSGVTHSRRLEAAGQRREELESCAVLTRGHPSSHRILPLSKENSRNLIGVN